MLLNRLSYSSADTVTGRASNVIEQEPKMESIEGFGGSIVSALRLLVPEAGVVDPGSGAFRELSTALRQSQAKESEAAGK